MWLRHLLAIAALPFMVAVVVPAWLSQRYDVVFSAGDSAKAWLLQIAGVGLLAIGVLFFAASLHRFVTEGKGTLAPWDPPRQLVVRGPYRYVRNPMISGVVLVVVGESLVLLSSAHALWALFFLGLNLAYLPLVEEPQLKRRFGEPYLEYCRHVPRVLPRLRPWLPPNT